MALKISVFIPAYNEVRKLELALAGYCRQTCRDFELFIADDGSGPELPAFVRSFSQGAPFKVAYTSQPDEGFRRARILNQAVRESSAECLIFADADCIPHRSFVKAHSERKAPRGVLCGRRVHLSAGLSATLSTQRVLAGTLERLTPRKLADALLGRGGHWDEGITLRNPILHGLVNRKVPSILGSNFSLDRELFEEVNGFNEDFVGYGGEDTELEYRLRLAGAQLRWVRHRAIQYHLYHAARPGNSANMALIRRTQTLGVAACAHGLRRQEGQRQ